MLSQTEKLVQSVVTVLLLIAIVVLTVPMQAQEAPMIDLFSATNVRSGPGTNYSILGVVAKYNTDSLKRYQKALTARVDLDTATKDVWYPNLTDAKVNGERDYYRKNRDMLIIGFFALYTLQIIDANVDAHLREFEVNKDLALRITPDFRYTSFRTVQPGLTLALRLK